MRMKPIKVKFTDFWTEDVNDIWIYSALKEHFNIELSDEPDVLIYSVFGEQHLSYKCKKVFFTTENVLPDYRLCDYSIGFNYDAENKRHLRYPLYLFYDDINALVRKERVTEETIADKSEFCVFVVSNPKAQERIQFFQKLDSAKHVDSAGRVLNNMPENWNIPVGTKYLFLSKYRFNITFENSAAPGYTTEKIYEPMHCNTIPIYWGDPLVHLDFNPKSFIHVRDYKTYDDVVKYILEIENNKDLYLQILNEPYLHGNVVPEHLKKDRLFEFFERIFFKDDIQPVSQQASFAYNKLLLKTTHLQEKFLQKFKRMIK